ncbi:unnamed protein product [Diabrotica balteata]|uniref:Endonuclease/exonuclease/phosphatase domain-containing protein n=1 Tax=Diabrotica balteata TaxID=107213 RepID=A0A9N9XFP4_DIABA|nr:unnamed protein product [Diabrotica balteata]
MKMTKKHEVTMVMGDFNAKVGRGKVNEIVGNFGLGERNDRGDRLICFCQEYNLLLSNTLFKLPKRRLYTWKSPADLLDNIIRNQIDYIAVSTRYKNMIKSSKTYPGADVPTDHNLLVCRMVMRVKWLEKRSNLNTIDVKKLTNPETEIKVREQLGKKIKDINENTADIIERWDKSREAIQTTCATLLKRDRRKNKEWMSDEIVDKMDERRKFKNKNAEKYQQIHKTIRTKIRQAKEKWFSNECREIEQYERKYDSYNMRKKKKSLTNNRKFNKSPNSIKDSDGNLISELSKILKTWKSYIQKLFASDRTDDHLYGEGETGPSILKSEIEDATAALKNNKSAGPDNVHCEILKILCKSDKQFLDNLVVLFNNIYNSGKIPENLLQSTFITIPKKPNAQICDDYRLISLINHVTKAFTKIIHRRIYDKCESNIDRS